MMKTLYSRDEERRKDIDLWEIRHRVEGTRMPYSGGTHQDDHNPGHRLGQEEEADRNS
jgi:hypothetical protein